MWQYGCQIIGISVVLDRRECNAGEGKSLLVEEVWRMFLYHHYGGGGVRVEHQRYRYVNWSIACSALGCCGQDQDENEGVWRGIWALSRPDRHASACAVVFLLVDVVAMERKTGFTHPKMV